MSFVNTWFSTLATDRGFKERVREDMLVRLLDAFVWRNHGYSTRFPLLPDN
jgi:cell cycle arrest protein BUB2